MRWRKRALAAGLAVLLGCATLSKEECLRGDWRELGVRDGIAGEPAGRIEKHRKACAEHGLRPDERLYLEGRAEGLREYCRIDNAFQTGLDGRKYQGVCPSAISSLFRRYNEAAYAVYETRNEIKKLRSKISGKESRLRSKKTSDEEKSKLRGEIREHDRDLDALRDDLRLQEMRLDALMAEEMKEKRWR